jgi:hypothetical protein
MKVAEFIASIGEVAAGSPVAELAQQVGWVQEQRASCFASDCEQLSK